MCDSKVVGSSLNTVDFVKGGEVRNLRSWCQYNRPEDERRADKGQQEVAAPRGWQWTEFAVFGFWGPDCSMCSFYSPPVFYYLCCSLYLGRCLGSKKFTASDCVFIMHMTTKSWISWKMQNIGQLENTASSWCHWQTYHTNDTNFELHIHIRSVKVKHCVQTD